MFISHSANLTVSKKLFQHRSVHGIRFRFVEYIVEQIADECGVSFKKMFGEYALYSNAKVVALVCDNQLFVKPTNAGKEYIGDFVAASAYSEPKPKVKSKKEA